MSYDIKIVCPCCNQVLVGEEPHGLRGGTYALNEDRAKFNITYNYCKHFRHVLDEEVGIRCLYGKRVGDTLGLLKNAASKLEEGSSEDYWEPTEGNARVALESLVKLAERFPDGIWAGD